jgi:CheY-like chemotaxis protein
VTERALHKAGYTVTTVTSGHEAVQAYREALLREERFDVSVLDLTVPGAMGGKDAAKLILDLDPEAYLIVSSGYSEDAVMGEYRRYGFSDVLPKPFNASQLCAAVARPGKP